TEKATSEAPTTEKATSEAPTTEKATSEAVTIEPLKTIYGEVNAASKVNDKEKILANYLTKNTNITHNDAIKQIKLLNLDYRNLSESKLLEILLKEIVSKQKEKQVVAPTRTSRNARLTLNVNNTEIKHLSAPLSSSLSASDIITGPTPEGYTSPSQLGELTAAEVAKVSKEITWINFSNPNEISNYKLVPVSATDPSKGNNIGLKVGTTFKKEIAPGVFAIAVVKSLQPFESTDIYNRRSGGVGYNPTATNMTRKDALSPNTPTDIVVRPQDANWSHLALAGMKTGALKNNFGSAINGGNIGATLSVQIVKDGVVLPANIVMADGEEAKSEEGLIMTTNGDPWKLLANVQKPNNVGNFEPNLVKNPTTGADSAFTQMINSGSGARAEFWASPDKVWGGLGSQVFGPVITRQDTKSVPIIYSENASEVSFFINSRGQQTVQIGFIFSDQGDAPASYGIASHNITEGDVNNPYLGTIAPDMDFSNDQTNFLGDDNVTTVGYSPDEGEAQLVGQGEKYNPYKAAEKNNSLTIIANTGENPQSYVRGWIDINNDGKFTDDEASQLVTLTTAKDAKIKLDFIATKQILDRSITKLAVRVRTSTDMKALAQPTGIAIDGEVEDFQINVLHPPIGEVKTTTGTQGQQQVSKVNFTAFGSNNSINSTVPIKIVSNDGSLVDSLVVENEGTYTVSTDGTVTFTPLKQFVGTATGVVLRATDKNGQTSGWTNTNVTSDNINKNINNTTTMDGVYIPTVTAVTPTGLNVESKNIQGKTQYGTPTFTGGTSTSPIDVTYEPKLIDATGNSVTSVVVPNEGTYTIDSNGRVTFVPLPTYVGTGTGVTVQRQDTNGTKVTATYTPTVTAVTPTGTDVTTSGAQGQTQSASPIFTAGNSAVPMDASVAAKLVDATGNLVDKVDVPNVGSYVVDSSGKVIFTPLKEFVGTAPSVTVQREDINGTKVTATYTPTVTVVTPTSENAVSVGKQGQSQTGKPIFTSGDNTTPMDDNVPAQLIDTSGNKVESITIPNEGTYTVSQDGQVIFQPVSGFIGVGTGVTVERQDANGTKITGSYTPTVEAVTPNGKDVTTTGMQNQEQQGMPIFEPGDISSPIDTTVPAKLVNASGELVDNITVPGEGVYTVTPDGMVIFKPESTFVGTAQGVTIEVQDTNGTKVTAKYLPVITAVEPSGENVTTEGAQGAIQIGTPLFTAGDSSAPIDTTVLPVLINSDGSTSKTIVVPNEGTYTIDDNGRVTFKPEPTFVGTAQGVTVEVQDTNGTKVTATYVPTVTAVTPTGEGTVSEGPQGAEQTGKPVFKGGNDVTPIDTKVPAKLVNTSGELVDSIIVPGEGVYIVAPDGTVTFKPEPTFVGTAQGVTVEVQDTNGTKVTATYVPTVTAVTPTGEGVVSEGPQGADQTGKPVFTGGNNTTPIDTKVPAKLVNASGELVDSIIVPGEGVYTVAPDGAVTFKPEPTFVGTATGVTVEVQDTN
ncbi:GEVED domain-containing protein, partial [Macrococcus capreoli]